MRFTTYTTASALAALATAQTFTDCNPTNKTCPNDPAMPQTWNTDFTAGKDAVKGWTQTYGSLTYGSEGAEFTVAKKGDAPTIGSDAYFHFGYVEVVMKAAPGQGIISSIVLESDDLDEIDWEWIGGDSSRVQQNYFGKGNTTTYDRMIEADVANNQDEFHTYALNWTSASLTWIIDGKPVRTLNYADANGGKNYPQTPCNVRLGNWPGGDSKDQGTVEWAGGKVDYTKAPFTMTVKSVKVINYSPGTAYKYTDMSGDFGSIEVIGAGDAAGAAQNTKVISSSAPATATADAAPLESGIDAPTATGGAGEGSDSNSTSPAESTTCTESETTTTPAESTTCTESETATTPAATGSTKTTAVPAGGESNFNYPSAAPGSQTSKTAGSPPADETPSAETSGTAGSGSQSSMYAGSPPAAQTPSAETTGVAGSGSQSSMYAGSPPSAETSGAAGSGSQASMNAGSPPAAQTPSAETSGVAGSGSQTPSAETSGTAGGEFAEETPCNCGTATVIVTAAPPPASNAPPAIYTTEMPAVPLSSVLTLVSTPLASSVQVPVISTGASMQPPTTPVVPAPPYPTTGLEIDTQSPPVAPYPTGTGALPQPSGSGSGYGNATTSAPPAEFTGAASHNKAGVLIGALAGAVLLAF